MAWRSYPEDKPAITDDVLCRSDDVLITDGIRQYVGYLFSDADAEFWSIKGPDAYTIDATHWQPLPTLPPAKCYVEKLRERERIADKQGRDP